MEVVYFYNKKDENLINDIVKDDEFMRLGRTTRDISGPGVLLFLNGSEDDIKKLSVKFDTVKIALGINIEKITGTVLDDYLLSFKKEEENAACGLGMIFG
jgi:hypothetical protein